MTTGKGKYMKVHSLLKSLNAIDEEMIAEADRFAVKQREQLKSRQHIFVTEVTAVAAIAIAVAGVFFFSLQPGHTPQRQSGQDKNNGRRDTRACEDCTGTCGVYTGYGRVYKGSI